MLNSLVNLPDSFKLQKLVQLAYKFNLVHLLNESSSLKNFIVYLNKQLDSFKIYSNSNLLSSIPEFGSNYTLDDQIDEVNKTGVVNYDFSSFFNQFTNSRL